VPAAGKLVVYLHGASAAAPAGAAAPCGNSHRLESSVAVTDGHGSTTPSGASPKVGGAYLHAPVWATMFGR